jgi:hypothetical protein
MRLEAASTCTQSINKGYQPTNSFGAPRLSMKDTARHVAFGVAVTSGAADISARAAA